MTPSIRQPVYKHMLYYRQEAREAYHSVMVVRPRRPISQEFLEFEQNVFELAYTLNNYTWPAGAEVSFAWHHM